MIKVPEIDMFKIYKADVELTGQGINVRLFYPEQRESLTRLLPEQLEFGVRFFETLLEKGYAEFATADFPIRPPSAGSMYVFKDMKFLIHRRDPGARLHPLYHSMPVGYNNRSSHAFSASGIMNTMLRESSEENLLITRDGKRLLVPRDARPYVLDAAEKVGLDLTRMKIEEIDVETLAGPDRISVFYNDKLQFSVPSYAAFSFEGSRTLNAMTIRFVDLNSEDILPVDGEGMEKDGRWVLFNRESYIVDPSEMDGVMFGDALKDPEVYVTEWENTSYGRVPRPRLSTAGYPIEGKPRFYYGPDKKVVTEPHVFAPDDLLIRMLDVRGISGYAGHWMELEIEKTKKKLGQKKLET